MKYFLTMILTCLFTISVVTTATAFTFDTSVDENKVQCSVNMLQANYLQFLYTSYEKGYTQLITVYNNEEELGWKLVEELVEATANNDVAEFNAIQDRMRVNSTRLNELKAMFKLTKEAADEVEVAYNLTRSDFHETYNCKQYAIGDMVDILLDFCDATSHEMCGAVDK